jgi:L-amino acid N-acyltransferase YncA
MAKVRDASPLDGEACAAIYAPYVTETAISFETVAPTGAEMAERIASAIAWFVGEVDGRVAGYAYAGRFHPRAAYRWACEVGVYLAPGHQRKGAGRALYDVLLPHLTERGYRSAIAGMTLPNPGSEGLHRALGFEPVGTYRDIGYKFGAWHDVAWTQRILAAGDDPPAEPT